MYTLPLWKPLPKNYKYLWQIMAFLEVNEKEQYILPFSRRVVYTPNLSWLPQSQQSISSTDHDLSLPDYISHPTRQAKDYSLSDDELDKEVAAYFNRPLYNTITETDDDERDDDDEQHQSTDLDDGDIDYEVDSYSSESYIPSSQTTSPFPCGDPFSDYDLEC